MSNTERRQLGSVLNAMRALRVLSREQEGVGVSALARELGIGRSSAHLLLTTLGSDEFVIQRPDGRYQLGVGVFEVGVAATGLAGAGGPLTDDLRGLATRSREAVSLASVSGADAIIVQRIESASMLRAEIRVGTRMPLHASASGKYLLSQMTEQQLLRLFPSENLPRVAVGTLPTRKRLFEDLALVRERGFASQSQEYADGVLGVATGVRDASGEVILALSVAGPTHRFDPMDWVDDLMETADHMTADLQGLNPILLTARHGENATSHEPERRTGT